LPKNNSPTTGGIPAEAPRRPASAATPDPAL